jgi:hypothetical protein
MGVDDSRVFTRGDAQDCRTINVDFIRISLNGRRSPSIRDMSNSVALIPIS